MKVYYELSLLNFEAWGLAKNTLTGLTYSQILQLERWLDDVYDSISEVELNDFLAYDTDVIADILDLPVED